MLLLNVFVISANAQDFVNDFFKTAPKITKKTLVRTNNIYQFKTDKWTEITDKNLIVALFGIENDKNWTGAKVQNVRFLGWWGLSDKTVAYIYAYEATNSNNEIATNVFIATFDGITKKGIDIDPFGQTPAPIGMKGKIIITQTLNINEFGVCTLISQHKSPNKKFSKTVVYSINENGSVNRL